MYNMYIISPMEFGRRKKWRARPMSSSLFSRTVTVETKKNCAPGSQYILRKKENYFVCCHLSMDFCSKSRNVSSGI